MPAWLLADRLFHLSSLRATGMRTGPDLDERFYDQTQPHRREFFAAIDRQQIEPSQFEHLLILDAIERGVAEEAADLHRIHIRRSRKQLAAENARRDDLRDDDSPGDGERARHRGPLAG